MSYESRAEQANDYDYSDEPLQAVVDRQRDVIELMTGRMMDLARENERLRGCIAELEREHVAIPAHREGDGWSTGAW